MRLTVFSDYTLRTLMYLAMRPAALCTIEEIADAYRISANHLMKVVQQAAKAGDVQTVRGQRGGLRLARAPETINVGAVLRRTEPDLHIAPCFASGGACCITPACVLQRALGDALAAFFSVMDRVNLADLVRPKRELAGLLRLVTVDGELQAESPFGAQVYLRAPNRRRHRAARLPQPRSGS